MRDGGGILDLIDNATEDWTTSVDAMRWTGSPPTQTSLVRHPSLTMRVHVDETSLAEIGAAFRRMVDSLTLTAAQAGRAVESMGLVATTMVERVKSEGAARQEALEQRRRRHTGPPPPRMDGRRR